MQEVELGTDEQGRVAVAGPPGYGDHVEGLVEEGSEGGEGVEKEGVCWVEGEV